MPGAGVNLLPGVSLVRIGIYAAIVAGIYGAGAYFEHGRMQKKLDAAVAVHNQFKGGVAALGHDAIARNAKIALQDLKKKERADEENERRTAALAGVVRGLRADAASRDSRGGSAAPAPAASRCSEEQVCFDRPEYQRAIGAFDSGARRLADEGTKVNTDLDTAIRWAD